MPENTTDTVSTVSSPVQTSVSTSSAGVKTIFSAAESATPKAVSTVPEGENSTSEVATTADTWYLAPGIPGSGPKPDGYIDSKYGSVLEQAQGYNNLRKKLGAFTGAPEAYDLDLSKIDAKYSDVKLDMSDESIKSFLDLAKESNMNQESVHKFLKYKVDLDLAKTEKENQLIADYTKKEVERLGPNAHERIETLRTWWKQNFSEFPVEKMESLGQSADFIEMLESVKAKFKFNPVPVDNAPLPTLTRDDARAMLNDPKYRSDKEYRQKVDAIYAKFI